MGHEQLIVSIYALSLTANPAIMANPTAFAAQVNIANFGPEQIKAMVAAQVGAKRAAAPAAGVPEPAAAAAPHVAAAVADPTPSKHDSGDLAANILKAVAVVTPETVLTAVRAMSSGLSLGKGVVLDNCEHCVTTSARRKLQCCLRGARVSCNTVAKHTLFLRVYLALSVQSQRRSASRWPR